MSIRIAVWTALILPFIVGINLLPLQAQRYIYDAGNPTYGVNIPVENGFINVTNGNLHMEFHLANTPQRGNLHLDEKLVYDSHFWEIGAYSNYYWWPDSVPRTSQLAMGWRFVAGAETGTLTYKSTSATTVCQDNNERAHNYYTYTYFYSWQAPDGTVHPFGNGYSFQNVPSVCADRTPPSPETSSGASTDASGYTLALSGTDNAAPTTITIRD